METSSHHHLPIFMNAAVQNILKESFVKIDVDLHSLKETEQGKGRKVRSEEIPEEDGVRNAESNDIEIIT
jgi:hypothetical protein